jgi:hypothetical protein
MKGLLLRLAAGGTTYVVPLSTENVPTEMLFQLMDLLRANTPMTVSADNGITWSNDSSITPTEMNSFKPPAIDMGRLLDLLVTVLTPELFMEKEAMFIALTILQMFAHATGRSQINEAVSSVMSEAKLLAVLAKAKVGHVVAQMKLTGGRLLRSLAL